MEKPSSPVFVGGDVIRKSSDALSEQLAAQEARVQELGRQMAEAERKQGETVRLLGSYSNYFRTGLERQLSYLKASAQVSQEQIRKIEGMLDKMAGAPQPTASQPGAPAPTPPAAK